MAQLDCTAEELAVIQQVLQHRLDTLDVEIRHTDHAEFRDLLRRRRLLLDAILHKIPADPDPAGR